MSEILCVLPIMWQVRWLFGCNIVLLVILHYFIIKHGLFK